MVGSGPRRAMVREPRSVFLSLKNASLRKPCAVPSIRRWVNYSAEICARFLRYGAAHHQGEHNKGASHNSRNPEHVEVSEGRRLLLAKFIEDAYAPTFVPSAHRLCSGRRKPAPDWRIAELRG